MKEIREIIEFLYSSFLLRDLAGKVVPGGVILVTIVKTLNCPTLIATQIELLKPGIEVVPWILILILCWILGLGAQAIGRRIKIVHYSFKYPTPDDFHKALRKFDNPERSDRDRQRLERFMAIREAYGNGAAAVIVAFVLWLLLFYSTSECTLPLPNNFWRALIIAITVFISLLLGHRETVTHQDSFLSVAIEDN